MGSATNFSDLMISDDGQVLEATGPFDYDDCLWISVQVVQTTQEGHGAVAARTASSEEKPISAPDDVLDPPGKRWLVELENTKAAGSFVAGRASAAAVAVVRLNEAVFVTQWSRDVQLEGTPSPTPSPSPSPSPTA